MARMAALDGGTYYHDESLRGQRFRGYFDRTIYLPDLAQAPLDDLDALIVTCRSSPDILRASADRLRNFLESGKTLVAMGECEAHTWLPLDWTPTPTNFWWWLDSGADPGIRIAAQEHPLFRTMTLADATWHHHGFFRPGPSAVSLIDRSEGGSILLEDKANFGPGRLIATTLDPFYHHGSFFMPAATRFLDKFLPWLTRTLDEERTK